jgi:hypothetical protein
MQEIIHRHMDGKGTITLETVQDCTPIAELCKQRHNEGRTGTSDMRLAASIPEVIVTAYMQKKGITFHEFQRDKSHVRALLSDPALEYFRVWKGKI